MLSIKRILIVALVIISVAKSSEAAETCDQLFGVVSPIQKTFTQLAGEGLSLAFVQTHTPIEVVESIVANRRARMKAADKLISKADFISVDLMDPANELMLFFRSHDRNQEDNTAGIESIQKNGFLSLFETGTSNSTNLDTSWRERVEQWTAGSSLRVLSEADATLTSKERLSWLSLHPKSMIVNLATVPMFDRETGDPNRYGDVAAVFKNELKKRAIWTSDDSLEMLRYPYESSVEGFNELNQRALDEHSGTFEKEVWLPKKAYKKESYEGNPLGHYFESQVYGPVSVDNVAYLMVDRTDYVKALETLGKPIYLLNRVMGLNRAVYKKGRLLYTP